MSEDTSLSEFVGKTGESDRQDGADGQDETVETAETTDADGSATDHESAEKPDEPAVEPARATYDWTPDGAACTRCGAAVEKRWRDDGGMVCADCKEW
ncbi:hypothetical protein ZOD2009_11175 [Haladaptatus paucihalophilus DX253]|uniref:DUF7573 domain-containing protein n=1 Tax=Haladaptatus paucihalophilus DX253 TaxID=797209 RepID=E7QTV5_HALPU|nr:hypothetical protein [Haladaptatus paucihalophilus]EFW92034.1 hypothetical protein ZOD2009_11175 [Haladaptatus paucihalophilus DX253]SHK86363.1 hypothetical protein SAMN05444342_2438 [Haladaptatus paucihalophilus DX253]